MSKKSILPVILLLLFFIQSFAQNPFESIYDNGKEEYGVCIRQTYDKGYILLGSTGNFFTSNQDFYLVKTDSAGNILWEKNYGGSSYDIPSSLLEASDSGFFLFGYTNSFGAGAQDMYLIRTDKNGDTLWTKTYGGASTDYGFCIIPTFDNGFLLTGSTYSFGPGNFSMYAVKINANGDTLWTNTYGGTVRDEAFECIQTMDSGFALIGITRSFDPNLIRDIYLVKIDSLGNFQWEKDFGDSLVDVGYSIQQAADTGYLILGSYMSAPDTNRMVLIKTDKNGNLLWQKYPIRTQGDKGLHLEIASDGSIYITGNTFVAGKNSEMLLTKTDSNGDTLWTKHYGGASNEIGYYMQQTSDKGFAILGETEGFGVLNFDMYLVKTDSLGNITCSDSLSFMADSSICKNNLLTFTNTTVGSGPFTWIIGDSTYNSVNAYYFFDSAGTYQTKLATCIDTFIQTIIVNPVPAANFTFQIINDSTASFAIDSNLSATTFVWNFGDTSALDSVNPNPVHTFPFTGPYNVNLTITDSNGCTYSTAKQVGFFTNITKIDKKNIVPVIYPNPVFNNSVFYILGAKQIEYNLDIFDLAGNKIKHYSNVIAKKHIITKDLNAGIYFYNIMDNNKIITRGKLIII